MDFQEAKNSENRRELRTDWSHIYDGLFGKYSLRL